MTARHRLPAILGSLLIAFLFASAVSRAQSEADTAASAAARAQSRADTATIEKARAIYFNGPIPGSIACNATVDWAAFLAHMKNAPADPAKPRLEKLKQAQISFVAQDQQPATVKVEQLDSSYATISDGLSQQLQAFFQMYWTEAYGRLFLRRGVAVELRATPDGYEERSSEGETNISVAMSKAYLITHLSLHSPGTDSEVKPSFKSGADGLLRLRGIQESVEIGSIKVDVLDAALDYQKVGNYEVPQHVTVSVPDSYSFDYTFSGCTVTAPGAAASAANREPAGSPAAAPSIPN